MPGGPVQQPRLARAAFAGDQHHAPGAARRRGGDGPELIAAPDEQVVLCRAWLPARPGRSGLVRALRGPGLRPAQEAAGRGADLLVLTENGLLDLGQGRTGLQPEFVAQNPPGPAQRGQRVRLPVAGPQREGEKPPAPLAQRLLADQRLSRRNGLGRGPGPERDLGPGFLGGQMLLGQPGYLGRRPLLIGELGVRRAAPERQRLLEVVPGPFGLAGRVLARRGEQGLEPPGVHGFVRQPHRVPRRRADQDPGLRPPGAPGFEDPPEVRHVRLQRPDRPRRRLAAPQVLDQPVDRHDLAARDEQQGQDRPLARPAEIARSPSTSASSVPRTRIPALMASS